MPSAMKTHNTISTNGSPFEYQAMPTMKGTVVRFEDEQYVIPIGLYAFKKIMQSMFSKAQVHDVLQNMNKPEWKDFMVI